MDKNNYIPMHKLIYDTQKSWTFTSVPLTPEEIAVRGLVLWCLSNIDGRWTMLGGNKFAFEDGPDALLFKIRFGFA